MSTVEWPTHARPSISCVPVSDWSVPKENRRRLGQEHGSGLTKVDASRRSRVAILSLLFNWPSTGGGTVHTAETGKFLSEAGYDVRHFYATAFPEWGAWDSVTSAWRRTSAIQSFADRMEPDSTRNPARRWAAQQSFQPDWVIVTDSWNSKPISRGGGRAAKIPFYGSPPRRNAFARSITYDCSLMKDASTVVRSTNWRRRRNCCECVFHKNGKFTGGFIRRNGNW